MRPIRGAVPRTVGAMLWLSAAALLPPPATARFETGEQSRPGTQVAATREQPQVSADGYTSSRVCGQCHADIYGTWKNSLHAFALADPIFDAAFMQALKQEGEEAKRICLRCHTPMAVATGDWDLEQGVTREGVSCDFCHTVSAVDLARLEQPYTTELGLVKRSVLQKAASPAHQVAYSELHSKSEFCGGCHSYRGKGGVLIMGTYDEWLNGPYARRGVQCQNCHMGLSRGNVVSPGIVRDAPSQIHVHSLIHDTDQLRSALAVRVVDAERSGTRLSVDVEVENIGSGHMVPTGLPKREIVLSVEVGASGRTQHQDRHYRKVVADERGNVLEQDYEVLLYGAKVLNDNRIAPGEKRRERLTFDVPATGGLSITASLTYSYSAPVLRERRIDIKLADASRTVY